MFFDVIKKKMNMGDLLLELARKRNKLWRQGQKIETEEIFELKRNIEAAGKQNGLPSGIYWWEIPWEKVQEKLSFDTTLPKGTSVGSWEWDYALEHKEKDGVHFLFLMEHGRKYGVQVRQDEWEYKKDSKYSESEQRQMVKDYNSRINQQEFFMALTTEEAVYSSITDTVYDSVADYFLSAEHWMIRDHFSDKYKRSLYRDHWIHHFSVDSANVHCRNVYGVAGYHLKDGILDFMKSEEYRLLASEGPASGAEEHAISGMDAIVMCGKHLAGSAAVKQVPRELLGKDITKPAATYEEAMRQAELFVCLAQKMS